MKVVYYLELIVLCVCIDFILGAVLLALGMYPQSINWETSIGNIMFEPSVILISVGGTLFFAPYIRKLMFREVKGKNRKELAYGLMLVGAIIFTLTAGGGLLEKCASNHMGKTYRNSQTLSREGYLQVEKVYTDMCRQINAQTPIKIDEVTSLQSAAFLNRSLTIFYKVELDASDFTASDIEDMKSNLKQAQKQMAAKMLASGNYEVKSKDMREMLKATGIKWRFVYRDINDNFILEIYLDYTDF